MNNVVTFETAKRLKGAGFPQPKRSWYGCAIFDNFEDQKMHLYSSRMPIDWREHWIFAPSATDILKQLGGAFDLRYRNGLEGYEVVWFQNQYNSELFNHENPAEACAAAWLTKNEKP